MSNHGWGLTLAFAAFLGAAGQAEAAQIPACAGEAEVSGARVNRVEKNGDIVLDDGRAAVAEGIRLPAGAADRAPEFLADQAMTALKQLTTGKKVDFYVHVPKEDRYGRLRAQVIILDGDPDSWLQVALLSRGLARVDIAPDRTECAAELYAAERVARQAKQGIWVSSAYAVRTPDTLAADTGTFQIVQGTVTQTSVVNGRAYLNFGMDWKTDFTVSISPDDMKTFAAAGVDPRAYQGKTVRVRGMVQQLNGPEIEIATPVAIESGAP